LQCDGDAYVGGDYHHSVGALVHVWSAIDHFEEKMDHPLIRRPVLDEMGFVRVNIWTLYGTNSIYMNSVTLARSAYSGSLSKLLLEPANIPEFIEDLPDVVPLAKGKKMAEAK
jgi:hypothetical protein